jgi:HTH-type transcriptional regulator/antitoxin MqsA
MYPRACGRCGGSVTVSGNPVPVELRGETVWVPDVEHGLCGRCGEVFLELPAVELIQKEAVRRSKQARGLLTPDEIRDLRRSLGMSQAAFENLLGTGPKTVVRWEAGTVFQTATADRLMRVVRDLPQAVDALQSMGSGYSRDSAPASGGRGPEVTRRSAR